MENQQGKKSLQRTHRKNKSELFNADLKNLAGFLDELIKIDLMQKNKVSGGNSPLIGRIIKAGSNNEKQ